MPVPPVPPPVPQPVLQPVLEPQCPQCRADLVDVLTYRWLAAAPAAPAGGALPVLVVSCGRCATTLGVQAALPSGPAPPVRPEPAVTGQAVAATVPGDVRVDLRYQGSRLQGEVAGLSVDILVDGTSEAVAATGTIGTEAVEAEWSTGAVEAEWSTGAVEAEWGTGAVEAEWSTGAVEAEWSTGALAPVASLVLRSAGAEVALRGPVAAHPDGDRRPPVRLQGSAGAVEVTWPEEGGGDRAAVAGSLDTIDVELTIGWSREHAGGVLWGSIGEEALALDVRPEGAAMAVTGRYGGPAAWLLPPLGVLLLSERP